MTRRRLTLSLVFLSLAFLAITAGLVLSQDGPPVAPSQPLGKDTAVGEMRGGSLHVTVFRGTDSEWPADGPTRIWLTRLNGDHVASGVVTKDDRVHGQFTARLRADVPAGRNALYIVRYRLGAGEQAVEGSFSLAEVLGSLAVRVIGPNSFQAGTQAGVRVVAFNRFNGQPLADVKVDLSFKDKDHRLPLFRGATDAGGSARVAFPVPEQPLTDPSLVVVARARGQEVGVEQAVRVEHRIKILLTTDKPLYQPGQTMHIRALALAAGTRLPAAKREAVIEVADAKGNKVFKRKVRTSDFGVAAIDFALANEVNMGDFKIKIAIDDSTAEKTVEVKRYVLPKFKVVIEADRPWYLPGQQITGKIEVNYIFGKPVRNGEVTIEGLATIVGTETFATIQGRTNEQGVYEFSLKLPETLVGREVDQGLARVQLHATVTDPAGHVQEALRSFPVARTPLVIRALPESGRLIPGVENRVFIMVTSPDGQPAKAQVLAGDPANAPPPNWWTGPQVAATDALGLTEYKITPGEGGVKLSIRARDAAGNEVAAKFALGASSPGAALLLRTDSPIYHLGDTMRVSAFVSQTPGKTLFVDLVRDQQTLLTATADIKDGRADLDIPVTAEMVGGVVVTAYILMPQGNMVRDSRVVYVHPQSDLQVGITPRKKIYRPGEEAAIDFQVTDNQGHPIAAALGVTIVDEAVFAMQDMQPGLERVFFTLERELMTPRYEFHSFTPEQIVLAPADNPMVRRGWTAMLASVEPVLAAGVDQRRSADQSPEITSALERQARADMDRINRALKRVGGDINKLPHAVLLDPWGTPYRFGGMWEKQVYYLTSAGPNRVFNDDDDVTVVNEEIKKKLEATGRHHGGMMRRFGRGGGGGAEEGPMMMDNMQGVPPPIPAAMPRHEAGDESVTASMGNLGGQDQGGAPVRVREYFPETLYVNPELITDDNGRAHVTLSMADSITTWRIAAQAVSRRGLLGSGNAPVVVFQDFFVDIDFPVALTRNDVVKVPIALYNYLSTRQTVRLEIEKADWYELVEGGAARQVDLAPGEVKAEYIHLKAKQVGRQHLTVVARGAQQSDAVKREVLVEPDGRLFEQNISDQLKAEARHTVNFPENAIPGSTALLVKVYPGLMSQVVEGLDNIFRMPSGCFEQTSSTTYPNVMVLDYMKTTNQLTPAIQMKAEGFINQGYQRLLTFEVAGGGFEWFGQAPAHVILTAYGLMEFYDMSRVYEVDPAVIKRTQDWLARQQQADGSWKPSERTVDQVASAFTKDVVRNTAYVVWALARSQYKGAALASGVAFLEKHQAEAIDAYTLALTANAFVAAKPKSPALDDVFKRLGALRRDEGDASYWPAEGETAIRATGPSANIETTALAAQALILAKREADVVNRVVSYLVKHKDTFGTYYSTQATVWAMQVFLLVARGGGSEADGEVQVQVNGQLAGGFRVTPADSDVLRVIDATHLAHAGANDVVINFAGRGSLMYQVVGRHYIQWSELPQRPVVGEMIGISIAYDKTTLAVNDEVTCTVQVENHAPGEFGMVLIDVGVPPGFQPLGETIEALVQQKAIAKFSTTARQVTFYLTELKRGAPVRLQFKLKATFPMHAVAPQSRVYYYYNPDNEALARPVEMRVN